MCLTLMWRVWDLKCLIWQCCQMPAESQSEVQNFGCSDACPLDFMPLAGAFRRHKFSLNITATPWTEAQACLLVLQPFEHPTHLSWWPSVWHTVATTLHLLELKFRHFLHALRQSACSALLCFTADGQMPCWLGFWVARNEIETASLEPAGSQLNHHRDLQSKNKFSELDLSSKAVSLLHLFHLTHHKCPEGFRLRESLLESVFFCQFSGHGIHCSTSVSTKVAGQPLQLGAPLCLPRANCCLCWCMHHS